MAFVRVKYHNKRPYYYLVETHREGGKVKQRTLRYIGTRPPKGRQRGLKGSPTASLDDAYRLNSVSKRPILADVGIDRNDSPKFRILAEVKSVRLPTAVAIPNCCIVQQLAAASRI